METNTYYLSEIAEICDSRRIPLSAMERVKRHGKYRYYGAQGVIDYVDDFLFDGEYLLIAEDGENLKSLKQNIAQVVTGKFWVNNHAHIIQTNSKCRLRYLYYLINSMNISGYITGSAQPKLSQANMKKIELELPSVLMQDKILSVLGTIDDKIENNKKINKNLEEQAIAIYDEFISSHNYQTVTIGDLCISATTGADAIRKAPIVEEDTGIHCVRVGDMSNERPVHQWGFSRVTPEIFKQYQLHKDDIVVTRTATLGLNRLISGDLNAVYNNGLIRLIINKNCAIPLIVYRQLQTKDYTNYIARITGETSVRPNMKINYLLQYQFSLPEMNDQIELAELLVPIYKMQQKNIENNRSLAELRDALLPKIMSGEIDVSKINL